MKILLAVDDSKYSEAAAQAVMSQFPPEKTDVCVLHAVDITLGDVASQDIFEAAHAAKVREAKELVGRYEKMFKEAGFATTTNVENGYPPECIVDFAEEWRPDYIFLGSHGRRGLKRLTLGSVSEAVAHKAHSSVVIVRMPAAVEHEQANAAQSRGL